MGEYQLRTLLIIKMEKCKKAVGYAAAECIKSGMLVGLGTGSTVYYFIKRLIERVKEGLTIQVVSSSMCSEHQARKGGIPVVDINTVTAIDITVDGADEIDLLKKMIKGGGGALLREKILANISKEMMVIVDETKIVKQLGKRPLPIEILPFATKGIVNKIQQLGYQGQMRTDKNHHFYLTDNGNYIYDIYFKSLRDNPEKDHELLCHIPGVLETGFFFNLAGPVLIGKFDETVDRWF